VATPRRHNFIEAAMDVGTTGFKGLLSIAPRRFGDARGFFLESWQRDRYAEHGITEDFVQDNHSRSERGVLRGMHYTVNRPQAQIVTVMRGRIFDVAVDLRPRSATFGKWFGIELADDGVCQLYMAPGFAHGYCVLSDFADLHYKCSQIYDPHDEGGLLWNDPEVGIDWPLVPDSVSPRDAAYPRLREIAAHRLPHI
jgi:dTDP-4-dehydrorhamnose 3,5-epimerase